MFAQAGLELLASSNPPTLGGHQIGLIVVLICILLMVTLKAFLCAY